MDTASTSSGATSSAAAPTTPFDRVAIVTGGGTGVGRAAAAALVEKDWRVVITGRRDDKLREVAAELGEAVVPIAGDVTDEAEVTRIFAATVETLGRVDLLFNNAGSSAPPVPIDELSLEQWQAVVDVNLTGSFLCAREAFRVMKTQTPGGGRIINNGSISAQTPRPNSAPYTSTKHAITGLTKSLSLDGRTHQIAVGQLDIGNAATPMTKIMAEGVPQADGSIKAEPTMDVDEIGRAIVYMASMPLDSNVLFMTVMANAMPFVGRG